MSTNRRFLLVRRPKGLPTSDDFQLTTEAAPNPPDGGIVIQNTYVSIDPAIRGWIYTAQSYKSRIELGEAVRLPVASTSYLKMLAEMYLTQVYWFLRVMRV